MNEEQMELAGLAIDILDQIEGSMDKIAHNLSRIEEHMEKIEQNTRR